METLLWDTPAHAYHSVRVLCDQMGLSLEHCVNVDGVMYQPKDIICATIWGESEFINSYDVTNENVNSKGLIVSRDYGICQINDKYHIGEGLDFPSVDYVLNNPDKAVIWMINRYLEGHINWWCCYKFGRYKLFLGKTCNT